jgi:hypothetical protein
MGLILWFESTESIFELFDALGEIQAVVIGHAQRSMHLGNNLLKLFDALAKRLGRLKQGLRPNPHRVLTQRMLSSLP